MTMCTTVGTRAQLCTPVHKSTACAQVEEHVHDCGNTCTSLQLVHKSRRMCTTVGTRAQLCTPVHKSRSMCTSVGTRAQLCTPVHKSRSMCTTVGTRAQLYVTDCHCILYKVGVLSRNKLKTYLHYNT